MQIITSVDVLGLSCWLLPVELPCRVDSLEESEHLGEWIPWRNGEPYQSIESPVKAGDVLEFCKPCSVCGKAAGRKVNVGGSVYAMCWSHEYTTRNHIKIQPILRTVARVEVVQMRTEQDWYEWNRQTGQPAPDCPAWVWRVTWA